MQGCFITESFSHLRQISQCLLWLHSRGLSSGLRTRYLRIRVHRNVWIYKFVCMYVFVFLAVVQHVVPILRCWDMWASELVNQWERMGRNLSCCVFLLAFIQVLNLCCLSLPSCSSPFQSDKLSNKQCMLNTSLKIHISVYIFPMPQFMTGQQMLFDISL